jgi:hypothetical protein
MRWLAILVLALVCVLSACGTRTDPVTDHDDPAWRAATMTRLLRAMEDHPEYVDELYRAALRHPRVLDRLYANTARTASDDDFARRLADQLVAHPAALRTIVRVLFDAAADDDDGRRALAEAIEVRATEAASLLAETPEQLATIAMTLFQEASQHPDAATRKQMRLFVQHLRNEARRPRMPKKSG